MRIAYLANARSVHFPRWYQFFVDRGHEVILISGDVSQIDQDVQPDSRIKVYFLPEKKIRNRIISFVYNFFLTERRTLKKLNQLIEKIQPDILHAHQLLPYGYWGAKTGFHPLIITPIGSDAVIFAQKYWIYKSRSRFIFAHADCVTQDSLVCQEAGLRLGARRDQNYIIQNGVITSRFPIDLEGENIREKLGIQDAPLVHHCRALTALYNVDTLVKAWKFVQEKQPEARLLLTYLKWGDDNEEELRNLVRGLGLGNSIIFYGAVPYEEMPLFHAAADVTVSVPLSDNSPSSVYESMAAQTPVVISDLPWARSAMRHEENALLVPAKDVEKIATSICRLLDDSDLAYRLASRGRETVFEFFDYEKNMGRMLEVMNEMVEEKKWGESAKRSFETTGE
jgi:L-malate glycosyltransferase